MVERSPCTREVGGSMPPSSNRHFLLYSNSTFESTQLHQTNIMHTQTQELHCSNSSIQVWDNTSYHRENLDPTSILRHILPLSSRGGAGFLRSLCTYQHRTSKYYNMTFARLKQRNIILDTCHASPACKTPVPRKNSNFLLLTCKERQVSLPPLFFFVKLQAKENSKEDCSFKNIS